MKKFTLFFLFCALLSANSWSQVQVSTVTDEFPGSGGVKYGPDGNVYIGNYGDALPNSNGTQIWRWEPDGTFEVFASGFQGASGNTFDSSGDFFQSNISGNKISKVDPDGNVTTFVTEGIACPVGVAVDEADNLYVCNCCGTDDNMIRKVTPAGVSTPFAGGALFDCPNGITIDPDQNLYVSNFGDGRVLKITPAGEVSIFANLDGANNGHLTYSSADNSLYVASHGSSKIFRVDMDQEVFLVAGSGTRGNTDGPAFQSTFSRPNGIALSSTGDTMWVNSSIPITNVGLPLNPVVLRMVTGLQGLASSVKAEKLHPVSKLKISPNPSTGPLQFEILLLESSDFEVQLYDLNGKRLASESVETLKAGAHTFNWNPGSFADGLYQINVVSDAWSISRRIVLLK